jgi:hypothetical protein
VLEVLDRGRDPIGNIAHLERLEEVLTLQGRLLTINVNVSILPALCITLPFSFRVLLLLSRHDHMVPLLSISRPTPEDWAEDALK